MDIFFATLLAHVFELREDFLTQACLRIVG